MQRAAVILPLSSVRWMWGAQLSKPFPAVGCPRRSAIFTSSANDLAPIFVITRPRCAFTVISLIEIAGHLLVQQPTHDERHDLPLPQGEASRSDRVEPAGLRALATWCDCALQHSQLLPKMTSGP